MNSTELASGLGREELAGLRCGQGRAAREPFTVRSSVGRLIELRVFDLAVPEDVALMNGAIAAAASAVGTQSIIVADARPAGPFPHEVGDAWSRVMRLHNAHLVRSAILLDPANDTFNLQLARVVRCAGSPRRRWFYDPCELRDWLVDLSTPFELARLDELLG